MTSTPSDAPEYRNPILAEDRPDPDAIRVGERFVMVTSSFNRAPGLPVLESSDLVNWEIVAHALPGNTPAEWFAQPRHGSGVWAPAIREHDGLLHIVYPDPDQGIFVVSAPDATGPWSEPRLLLAGSGIIDPCPLWDDDGATYLVHGWARSRAGMKNQLWVVPVDADLTTTTGPSRLVIDGDTVPGCTTLEGPKFYRRAGEYWIFAPAGGVATGWQSVFRSRHPFGPYEHRIVLEQGATDVNGPHQGAWVDDASGRDWFLHFQDQGAYGRVLHLQPMAWGDDGWPLMGAAAVGGTAEPVTTHPTPSGRPQGPRTLLHDDDFASAVGPNWSWQANVRPGRAVAEDGLRIVAEGEDAGNVRTLSGVIGQPLPSLDVTVEVDLEVSGPTGTRVGLGVLGLDYAWIGLRATDAGTDLVVATRTEAMSAERVAHVQPLQGAAARVRIAVSRDGDITVGAAGDPQLRVDVCAREGRWIGAEVVLFAAAPLGGPAGAATFRRFRTAVDDALSTAPAAEAVTA